MISGRKSWLWRAVDQEGIVLEEILQSKRDENSHLPFRKRARCMQGFRSPGGLQRFVTCQSAARNRFLMPARRRSANATRDHGMEAFDAWKEAANI
uniref:hypothetical protein n=1 Tax=Paracoccus seriniphilus TaxID=184748 RepID=UPI003568DA42